MESESRLDILGKEWDHQLRSLQYAGEIVVPEADLPGLAKQIRRELFSIRRSGHTNTCLLVLALNCMYYHHDAQGFWVHFCELIEMPPTPQNQTWLGKTLEDQLLEFHFMADSGEGPFRFVTPLREQCGITRTEIPHFANFLSEMSASYGWDGIRVLNQRQIADAVSRSILNRHLTQFLVEDHGFAFIRDITRSISQFQHGRLTFEELVNLIGYRTGFFAELFATFDVKPPPTPLVNRPPLPRLLFLPEFRQVGIEFDPRATMRGDYRLADEPVRQTPYLCKSQDDYCGNFLGERRDSGSKWSDWSICGWNPKVSPVGLFHVDRGFVDLTEDNIPPGEYFMLGPYDSPPPLEVCAGDLGMVDLPFLDLELDAWRIILTQETDLSFLGIDQTTALDSTDLIAWQGEGTQISGSLDSAIAFTGKLPLLRIRRPELFTSNAVALFLDDGHGTRRVPITPTGMSIQLDVNVPSQGRIWVEPIGRLREFAGRDMLCELYFSLLPECHILWPSNLCAFRDEPEVVLASSDKSLSLDLEQAIPIDATKLLWRVDEGVTVVQGYLRTAHFSVPIAKRIYRATLRKQGTQIAEFFLPDDAQGKDSWVLAGMPQQSVDLAISDGNETISLGTLGLSNKGGEFRFPGTAIRDAIRHWKQPIGYFAVLSAGQTVPTKTIFLDCTAFIQWISDADDFEEHDWINLISPVLHRFIDVVRALRAAPAGGVLRLDDTGGLPQQIQTYFDTLCACSAVFDASPYSKPAEIALETASPQVTAMLCWYLKAHAFIQATGTADFTAESLREEYKLDWKPPFPRWQSAIADAAKIIDDYIEPSVLVLEWKGDVNAGFRTTYSSRIAQQNGGRRLTDAWIKYSHFGQHQMAINDVANLIPQSCSPVTELAEFLLVLCCMRKGLFRSQPSTQIKSTNRKLGEALGEIRALARNGAQEGFPERPALSTISSLLSSLPLRQEDSEMIMAIAGESSIKEHDTDWLRCYLLCILYNAKLVRHHPSVSRQILNDIPPTPERQQIIDILERYLDE